MRLYCVGVGPGDPELITIKGRNVIEGADVIFTPIKSLQSESFALEIIRKVVDLSGKEIIKLLFPMVTNEEKLIPYWEKAYNKIKEKLTENKKCVFIVEGDPLIYSTFNSILKMAKDKNEFEVEIIPGISSFQAMAARLKVPIVDGDEILAIMPASFKEKSGCRTAELREDFEKIFDIASTIFIMKSGRVLPELINKLSNKKTLAFFGELCSTEQEFISELTPQLIHRKNQYFSTVMIKKKY